MLTGLLQERNLLASCLEPNPCLRWERVVKAYNTAAVMDNLEERNTASLRNMLQRSATTLHLRLQLTHCSRSLEQNSTAKLEQLHRFAQEQSSNNVQAVLAALSKSSRMIRRLCRAAEIGVIGALQLLPGVVGSQGWVEALETQCKIEAEVHFWKGAFCKKFCCSASMQQVYSAAFARTGLVEQRACPSHVCLLMLCMS